MPDIQLIYSPFPSIESARAASQQLLEATLAACCNIVPGVESHYWWEGTLQHQAEVILLCKTTPAQAEKAVSLLETLHPYECPAILRISADSNDGFAQWVSSQMPGHARS